MTAPAFEEFLNQNLMKKIEKKSILKVFLFWNEYCGV